MTGTVPQVRVGGIWLTSLGWWGDLVVTHRWPYGCWEATWAMNLRPYERPRGIVRGALVEVLDAGSPLWVGRLTEPDWSASSFTAIGLAREGETVACLSSGLTTSIPNAAIDGGIARGALSWIRAADFSSTPFGEADATDQINYVTDLLDARSEEVGRRWAVGPDRRVYDAADPVTPSWHVTPGSGELGVADEDYVTDVYGRYRTTAGAFATVVASDPVAFAGRVERLVDLTGLGRISAARAQATVDGILAKFRARTGWTNGVTVTRDQITSPGGVSPALSSVRAGQLVRMQGLSDPRGLSASTDIVLGETIWDTTEQTIALNPVGMAPRDLASVVETEGGRLLS